MSDKVTADRLIREEPNRIWEQMVEYRRNQGLSGNDIYQKILKNSQKTRTSVNQSVGIKQ